jgi:hypothetical protein
MEGATVPIGELATLTTAAAPLSRQTLFSLGITENETSVRRRAPSPELGSFFRIARSASPDAHTTRQSSWPWPQLLAQVGFVFSNVATRNQQPETKNVAKP